MKKRMLAAAGCITLLAGSALAQGSLTPPGAPAETMKTLEQVEPRIDLATVGGDASSEIAIYNSGSYYLSADLEVGKYWGIFVGAEDVTLDLNGFTIVDTNNSGYGIYLDSFANRTTVRNGSIVGFEQGIWGFTESCLFEKLAVSGCTVSGIFAGNSSRFIDCRVYGNPGTGIQTGWGSVLGGCSASYNGGGGMYAGAGSVLSECTAFQNDGAYGIYAYSDASITQCSARDNEGDGIKIHSNNLVRDCISINNGQGGDGAGIHVVDAGNRIEDNHLVGNDWGLNIDGTDNYVANNTVHGNTDNYDFAAGNQLNLLLGEIPEILDWTCSVKLAGTLTCSQTGIDGITVNANDVTIDLDGHALIGLGAGSGRGIFQYQTYHNLRVCNGTISGWMGDVGIYVLGGHSILSDLVVTTNHNGILGGSSSIVQKCMVNENINNGINVGGLSIVEECVVRNNGIVGIDAGGYSTVSRCTAFSNDHTGIRAVTGVIISGCSVANNGISGIEVESNNLIRDCIVNNTGTGIHVSFSGNRIECNNVTDNDYGIDVDDTGNIIVRNSASGNGTNYVISAGNSIGTIQTSPAGAGAWDNFEF